MANALTTLSPNVRKFVIFGAAIVVILIGVALVRNKTSVTVAA